MVSNFNIILLMNNDLTTIINVSIINYLLIHTISGCISRNTSAAAIAL